MCFVIFFIRVGGVCGGLGGGGVVVRCGRGGGGGGGRHGSGLAPSRLGEGVYISREQ